MSWKGFVRGLRATFSEPDYLRRMTPEERAERSDRIARQNLFALQMLDLPKRQVAPTKTPRSTEDERPEMEKN
jgi:hypothetical protein